MSFESKIHFFPETAFGGFSSVDGTIQFFNRINALVDEGSVVLDVGAGRGAAVFVDQSTYRRGLQIFRGRCKKIIGIDVDRIVLENPSLDEAYVIGKDGVFPVPDESIDLIICDHTLEHVQEPAGFSAEVFRVLKKGGVFCARTPNRWGYIGIGTNLVPNRLHVALLKYLQPDRLEVDVFPTCYKLNTRSSIRQFFPSEHWDRALYTWNAEPAYFGNYKMAWRFMLFLFRFLPSSMGATWNIFLRKQ
jgi:SAM-dependent methyltransferase